MKSKNLYVLVGVPGSGKSYYAKALVEKLNCDIVSRDEIRFKIVKEDEEYFSRENKVFNTYVKEIKNKLINDGICIADATHLTIASRKKLIKALNMSDLAIHLVVMNTDLNTCIERNENRTGRAYVPVSAIKRMYNSAEMPVLTEDSSYVEIIIVD